MLEAIGAKKRSDTMQTDSPGVNYQDSVSMPVSEEADNNAATWEGDDGVDIVCEDPDPTAVPDFVLPAVDKESTSIGYLSALAHSPLASKYRPRSSLKSPAEGTLARARL